MQSNIPMPEKRIHSRILQLPHSLNLPLKSLMPPLQVMVRSLTVANSYPVILASHSRVVLRARASNSWLLSLKI